MFSFSSPPHSTFYQQQRPTIYAFAHSPQTPSPLRTVSHNVNRGWMETNRNSKIGSSSPLTSGDAAWRSVEEQDENAFSPTYEQTPNSLFTTTATMTPSTAVSQTGVGKGFAFDFGAITPPTDRDAFDSASSASSKLFAYESRARSSSPAAQMSRHTVDSREKRKSMFLDRIRNRREDKREGAMGEQMGRMGDQILRMDYQKERRAWEEDLLRRGALGDGEMNLDLDLDVDLEEEEMRDEPSPTEEKEIEALVGYLEESRDEGVDDLMEGSDDEYDQLFLELSASQENGGGGGDGVDMDMS